MKQLFKNPMSFLEMSEQIIATCSQCGHADAVDKDYYEWYFTGDDAFEWICEDCELKHLINARLDIER